MSIDLTSYLDTLAARHGATLDAGSEWWTDPDSPTWAMVVRCFPGITRAAVRRDGIMADQALREFRMCKGCKEGQPNGKGGTHTCTLGKAPWEGDVLHPGGSYHAYLVYVMLPYAEGETQRGEWRKRECQGRERRAEAIATVMGRIVSVGPIEGEWVER
jgi:hypothetical protein